MNTYLYHLWFDGMARPSPSSVCVASSRSIFILASADICLSPPFRSISSTSIRDSNPTKHNDKDQTDREAQRKRKKQVNQESHLLSKSFLYSCKARIFVSLFLSSSQAPVYATIIQLSSPTKIKQAAKHSRSAQNKCHFRSLS